MLRVGVYVKNIVSCSTQFSLFVCFFTLLLCLASIFMSFIVEGRIMFLLPKYPPSNLQNQWICHLIWQRDFANVIKLRILRWADYPGVFEWVQCNHKSPKIRKREAEVHSQERTGRCYKPSFEETRTGHKPKNVSSI